MKQTAIAIGMLTLTACSAFAWAVLVFGMMQ
jgi:hypothetical protein